MNRRLGENNQFVLVGPSPVSVDWLDTGCINQSALERTMSDRDMTLNTVGSMFAKLNLRHYCASLSVTDKKLKEEVVQLAH